MSTTAAGAAETVYVVYQMGKVGSSSVFESIRRAGIAPVHKVHYLADQGLEAARRAYDDFSVDVGVPHESTSVLLRSMLRLPAPARRWKVVTVVREPIARDVSAYIQMVDLIKPELVRDGTPQVSRIARAVAAQFLGFTEPRNYTCQWFDKEFRTVFGVDVFEHPFDHGQGWQRITAGQLDVLVLRVEDLDRVFEEAMLAFSGQRVPLVYLSARSPLKLQAAYQQDVYQQILAQVRISARSCDQVYRSRYARHFYSGAELAAFKKRWSRTTGSQEGS